MKYYTCVIDGIPVAITYIGNSCDHTLQREKITNDVGAELGMMQAKLFDERAA